MRAVIQRVSEANVTINGRLNASIGIGLLVLIGFEDTDNETDILWLCSKIINLRIFDDANQVPNISVKENNGNILVVSQFTLFASTKKGNRPSYLKASKPAIAIPLYEAFLVKLKQEFGKEIYTGTFGADMKVGLINNGPITIIIDSKNKE